MSKFVVVNVNKFVAGRVLDSIISTPAGQKEAEVDAAHHEHLTGMYNTTRVVPEKEVFAKIRQF